MVGLNPPTLDALLCESFGTTIEAKECYDS